MTWNINLSIVIISIAATCAVADVTDLTLGDNTKSVMQLNDTDPLNITVVFEVSGSDDNLTFTATFDTNVSVIGIVDKNEKVAFVILEATSLSSLEFGSYSLTLTLEPGIGNPKSLTIIIQYNEPIEGFEVEPNTYHILAGETVQFNVTFTRGSNIDLEYIVNSNVTVERFAGRVRKNTVAVPFDVAAEHEVTFSASNTAGSKFVRLKIYSQFKVDGFTASIDTNYVQTRETITFTLKLNSPFSEYMGNISLHIDYGDGTNEFIEDVTALISKMKKTGYQTGYSFEKQGNFTVSSKVQSKVSHMDLKTQIIYVWDQLKVSLKSSVIYAKVDETVKFDFTNPPSSGFEYKVVFGDGDESIGANDLLFKEFRDPGITNSYNDIGNYEVCMTARNPFHYSAVCFTITVQYPIPDKDMSLVPVSDEIPIPGSDITFVFNMTSYNMPPTNVSCDFDLAEPNAVENNVSTEIVYGNDIVREYTYLTDGIKKVNFTCYNLVSTITKLSIITVRSFNLSDFKLHYQKKVNMNMTRNKLKSGQYEFIIDERNVYFRISLFACSKLPPNITFAWDFGDGTIHDPVLWNSFYTNHTYTKRGTNTIKIFMKSPTESYTHYYTIKLGVVDFFSTSLIGLINVTEFTFTAKGIDGLSNYVFDIDFPDESEVRSFSNTDEAETSFIYSVIGAYFPFVVGTNATFYERVYLDNPIKVDYSIKRMTATFSNTTIPLPYGNITVNISLPRDSLVNTLLECTFYFNDAIDKEPKIFKRNITVDEPILYEYNYLTLGRRLATINCSNLIESYYNESFIDVVNPCFVVRGMYDRHYSADSTPMLVSSSVHTDLSSRMPVLCHSPLPEYVYGIFKIEHDRHIPVIYEQIGRPSGTIRFRRGSIAPGTYKVALTVKLLSTWCYEFTFIKFERPPAQAAIVGGNRRFLPFANLLVDGLTETYNKEGGFGDNKQLNFTWYCYRYGANLNSSNSIEELFKTRGGIQYFSNETAVEQLLLDERCKGDMFTDVAPNGQKEPQGRMWLRARQNETIYFIIVLKVELDLAPMAYTSQIIRLVEGEPPAVRMECKINCREKLAISGRWGVGAFCDDCQDYEETSYEWFLYVYNAASDSYAQVPDLAALTETGIHSRAFVLRSNVLDTGRKYRLQVSLTVPFRKGSGKAELEIWSNLLPYGGSCNVNLKEGNATTTVFKVECPSWKDEGSRHERYQGNDNIEPLTYEYSLQIQRYVNGNEEVEDIPLSKAVESSASELLLPVGDKYYNYSITFVVRIVDQYGDFAVNKDCVVTSKPDEDKTPMSINDTAVTANFFNNYNETYLQLKASGNIIAVVRYVGATASLLSGLNVKNSSDEMAKLELQNKTTEFVKVFYDATSDENNETREETNAADTNNFIQNMKMTMKNKDLVNDESTVLAVKTVEVLTRSMEKKTKLNPYPVEDVDNLNKGVQGSLSIIDDSLDMAIPDELENLEQELTIEMVAEDLMDRGLLIRTGNLTEEEYQTWRTNFTQEEFNRRTKIRQKMLQKKEHGEVSVPKMVDSIEHMQDIQGTAILTGENETVLERPNVRITVEKTSAKDLLNRTEINKLDMTLQLGNMTNSTEDIELRTAVFKKVPYFYGNDADLLTSKGVMVSLRNGTEKPNIGLSLKIKNQGQTSFKFVEPEYIPGDSEKRMYFKALIRDKNDALIVYIRPDNFNPDDYLSIGLYDVMATTLENRVSSNFLFKYELQRRDWEPDNSAYKVFIPEGTLPKGKIYIILKPLTPPPLPEGPVSYRRKRSVANSGNSSNEYQSTEPPIFAPLEANFSLIILTTGCRTWSKSSQKWVASGCTVLPFSTLNETVCRCPNPEGQMFATTFYVPPNTIDFSSIFSKFDASNASIYGTVISLLVVYALACVWARRRDKSDAEKWRIRFLCDSDKDDAYFYLITVRTAMRVGAGTQSSVNFVLGGEDMDTGVRILSDGITQGFATGSVRQFIMGTHAPLGNILFLNVWHDNSGHGINKSWYLNEIIVEDPNTRDSYVFICDKWLSDEHGDGEIERHLTTTSKEDLTKFENLFAHHARLNITDSHLWLSLVLRPERSTFTRIQRLSCVLSLLFLTMIANAMFFRSQSDEVSADSVAIGSMRISLTTVYISLIGIIISTPPVLLMTYIFQNAKPKVIKKVKKEQVEEPEMHDIFKSEYKSDKDVLYDYDFYSIDNLRLPHWTLYIAWLTVVLAVLASGFFLVLYSMQWGKEKSEEWLLAFVMSFFESISMVDPLKVMLISVLLAVLFRKPAQSDGENLKMDTVRKVAKTFNAGTSRIYRTFRRHVLYEDDSSTANASLIHKQRREQERKAKEALKEIILYFMFAFIIYSIGYVNRDDRSFNLKNNIFKTLYISSNNIFGFDSVKSYEGYMTWMKTTFMPQFFPLTDFNGKDKLDERYKMFFADLENAKIGPARLRQVRIKKVECDYAGLTNNRYCVPDYNMDKEDDVKYCVGWIPFETSCDNNRFLLTKDAWKYKTSAEIWGMTIMGDYSSYGGGGFIVKLDTNLQNSLDILQELDNKRWINRETRSVFLEFTLYNANTNLFAYVVFLTEFTPFGGLTFWADAQIFRPYQLTGALGAYAIFCYFFFLITLIVDTIKIVNKLRNTGFHYFRNPWQFVDFVCTLISYAAVAMWAMRYYYAQESMKVYYNDKKAFINFQHVVIWDYILNVIIGVLIFISTLRILKILGYNKHMTEIASVVINASRDLIGFFIVFGIIFMAYIFLGYLFFGSQLRSYKSVFSTAGTLANALIGKNKLDSMLRAAPEMTQFYYFTYVIFIIFILLTMFAVILNQSISEVRGNASYENNVVGVLDVISNSAKDVIGLLVPFNTKSNPQKSREENRTNNSKNQQFDAPNVIRLVRETFGKKWQKEQVGDDNLVTGIRQRNDFDKMILAIDKSPTSPNPVIEIDQTYHETKIEGDKNQVDEYMMYL